MEILRSASRSLPHPLDRRTSRMCGVMVESFPTDLNWVTTYSWQPSSEESASRRVFLVVFCWAVSTMPSSAVSKRRQTKGEIPSSTANLEFLLDPTDTEIFGSSIRATSSYRLQAMQFLAHWNSVLCGAGGPFRHLPSLHLHRGLRSPQSSRLVSRAMSRRSVVTCKCHVIIFLQFYDTKNIL